MDAAALSRLRDSRFVGAAERPLDGGVGEGLVKKSGRLQNVGTSALPSGLDGRGTVAVCGAVSVDAGGEVHMDRWLMPRPRFFRGIETRSLTRIPRYGGRDVKPRAGPLLNEGPSCIFVGPLESAEPSRLEALYEQARDSYYSGRPLIVDDMFDRVEKRLRWHGSKVVMKYPRCSLRGFSAYADAEFDTSQIWALTGVWILLLASGVALASGPPVCMYNKVCQSAVYEHSTHSAHGGFSMGNWLTVIAMGLMAGIPVSIAAVKGLQSVWRGEVVALKGCCPSCGEEVYAFIKSDEAKPRHKTECHVCQHPLVFQVNVERVNSPTRLPWAYGRVYLVTQSKDLAPHDSEAL